MRFIKHVPLRLLSFTALVSGLSVPHLGCNLPNAISSSANKTAIVKSGTAPSSSNVYVAAGQTEDYVDSYTTHWLADTGFTGGASFLRTDPIGGCSDCAVYKGERYGANGTPFSYSFNNLAAGSYNVVLKFSDSYWNESGKRQFNVLFNDQTVLDHFDIVAQAGGKDVALDKTIPFQLASSGSLKITFNPILGDPLIDAIAVVGTGPATVGINSPTPSPKPVSPAPPAAGATQRLYLGSWWDATSPQQTVSLMKNLNAKAPAVNLFEFEINFDNNSNGNLDIQDGGIADLGLAKNTTFMIVIFTGSQTQLQTTDANLSSFMTQLNSYTDKGYNLIIRYNSEMNGNWFNYSNQPVQFKNEFVRLYNKIHDGSSAHHPEMIKMLWSPTFNVSGSWANVTNPTGWLATSDPATMQVLDTNHDGKLDGSDDGYSPYYPGDAYVDMVGLSMYYYGGDGSEKDSINATPAAGTWVKQLGNSGDFYNTYAKGHNKPFIIAETGVAWFPDTNSNGLNPGITHPAWWRQFYNADFISNNPLFVGAVFFDFQKSENGATNVDFRVFTNDSGRAKTLADDLAGLSQYFISVPAMASH